MLNVEPGFFECSSSAISSRFSVVSIQLGGRGRSAEADGENEEEGFETTKYTAYPKGKREGIGTVG
jgi:hypothetical protein